MELLNAIKALAGFVFVLGCWVTGVQFNINAHATQLLESKIIAKELRANVDMQEKKYIDVLGRIDERLKNIERNTK